MLTDNFETCPHSCGACSTCTTNPEITSYLQCYSSKYSLSSNINSRYPKFNCELSWRNARHKSNSIFNSGTLFAAVISILILLPTMSNSLPLHGEAGSSSGRSSRTSLARHPEKWINPCKLSSSAVFEIDVPINSQPDSQIFQNIFVQTNKALLQASAFMKNYYRATFGMELSNPDKYHVIHYNFLDRITSIVTKGLGDKMPEEELDALSVEDTLKAMYTGLQMYAVGLEQIVLDQSVYSGDFYLDFQEAEYQLKYVLCELQIAMLEKNIVNEDITREIMASDHRDVDCDTVRNIRDWVIFRDYVNTLEYMQQSFEYFLRKVQDSSAS